MTIAQTGEEHCALPPGPVRHYLDLGWDGRASHGRYAVGLLVLIVGGGIGSFAAVVLVGLVWGLIDSGDGLSHPLWIYVVLNAGYVGCLPVLWLVVRKIHRRTLRSLITGAHRVSLTRIATGAVLFAVAGLIAESVGTGVAVALDGWGALPRRAPLDTAFFWLIPLALLLTPIQTTIEELVFRGYLAQWIGRGIRRPWLLSLTIGLLFGALHLANPEMEAGAVPVGLVYVGIGALLMAVSIRDGTAELAVGAHAINNVLIVLLINSNDGSLPSPGLLRFDDAANGNLMLAVFVLHAGLFLILLRLFDRMTGRAPATPRDGWQRPAAATCSAVAD